MPTSAQARGAIATGAAVILLVGFAALLPTFIDGDQRLLLLVFAISSLAAIVWSAVRGMPQSLTGWLAPLLVAFGPAFLLGVYILAITANSP
jgi:hypothetical protein